MASVCQRLAASSWLLLLFGMVYPVVPLLAIASWIMSFVLARCLIGQAKNWNDLSNAQYAVLPLLVAGYSAILSAMLFWPAATTRSYLRTVLEKFPADLVVMEACGPSGWISDLCHENNLEQRTPSDGRCC